MMSQDPGTTPSEPSEPSDSIGYPLPPTSDADAGAETPGPQQPVSQQPSAYGTPPAGMPFGTPPEGAPGAPTEPSFTTTPAPAPRSGGLSKQQIRTLTPLLATILFFVCGFALDGWAWSWIFFLLVPVVMVVTSTSGSDD